MSPAHLRFLLTFPCVLSPDSSRPPVCLSPRVIPLPPASPARASFTSPLLLVPFLFFSFLFFFFFLALEFIVRELAHKTVYTKSLASH